jgi:hypothetical protein
MTEQSSSLLKIHTYAQDIDSVRADRKKNPKAFSAKAPIPKSPVSTLDTRKQSSVPAKKINSTIAKDIEKITISKKGEVKDSGYKAEIITDKKKPRLSASIRLKNIFKELFPNTKNVRPKFSNQKVSKSETAKAYTSPSDYEKVVAHLTKKYDESSPTDNSTVSLKTIPKVEEGNEVSAPMIGFSEIPTHDTVLSTVKTTPPNAAPSMPQINQTLTSVHPTSPLATPIPQPIQAPPTPHHIQADALTKKTDFVPPPTTIQTPNSILNVPPPRPLSITPKIEPVIHEKPIIEPGSNINVLASTTPKKELGAIPNIQPLTNYESKLFRFLPNVRTISLSQLTSLPIIISTIFIFGVVAFIVTNTQILSLRTALVPSTLSTDAIFAGSLVRTLVPSMGTRENIFGQINSILKSDATVTEVRLLNTFNGERIEGTALLNILDFTLPVTAKANVTMITFGSYREEPWIVMNIRDTNTVRGGILQWEVAMPQNLQGLFTITSPRPSDRSSFTDATVDTTDIRVFKNREGKEEIVYGFIRPNMLLITTDTLRFQNLQNNFNQ